MARKRPRAALAAAGIAAVALAAAIGGSGADAGAPAERGSQAGKGSAGKNSAGKNAGKNEAADNKASPQEAAAQGREVLFRFDDERITESSGLAASGRHDGIVYTHNDSSGAPAVYAVNPGGETEATLTLPGALARDWEAMAPCVDGDGDPVLWVGDIGDNIDGWGTYQLLRVAEPRRLRDADVTYAQFSMRYSDGQSRDAEALLCHPRSGLLYVVSKEAGGEAGVYRGPARMDPDVDNVFSRVADAPASITDGAFLTDGRHAVLRGYFTAVMVDADWNVVAEFTPPVQVQGESTAVTPDGAALLFGSEGVGASVWRVPLDEDFATLDDPPAAQPGDADGAVGKGGKNSGGGPGAAGAEDAGGTEGIPGVDGQMIALLSALGLGALVLALVARRD